MKPQPARAASSAARRPAAAGRLALGPGILTLCLPSLLIACRNAGDTGSATSQPIPVNTAGANGCSGPNVPLNPGQVATPLVLGTLVVGPSSQITAARGAELLYATGQGGQVVAIDVSVDPPVEMEIVAAADTAALLASAGVMDTPDPSGIAVLNATHLVFVERASNTILSAPRDGSAGPAFFAGLPSATPGFADGLAAGSVGLARFSFVAPSQLAPSADGRVFVADPGNHAIRMVRNGVVTTVAGRGTPGFADGSLGNSLFDTPTGIAFTCSNALLVSEAGSSGAGQRIRMLTIGVQSPFGGLQGAASTFVGDGTAATTGGSQAQCQVAGPASPLPTAGGDVYWIDADTGILRRFVGGGVCDCPLFADCDAAGMAPGNPAGHALSLTLTEGGALFVLDATDGVLTRVTP